MNDVEFIIKARVVHGDRYDYSKSQLNGGVATKKIIIGCRVHGDFEQRAWDHIRNRGCPRCGKLATGVFHANTQETFITAAKQVHGELFDYSNVRYSRSSEKVEIICREHGSFWQTPTNHTHSTNPQGCPSCAGNRRKTTAMFISHAKVVHDNLYDYVDVNYNSSHVEVTIQCRRHGAFLQTPDNHLSGKGCPKCAHRVSKPETKWLDSLGVQEQYRQKQLRMKSGKRYEVDAYDATTNTVYEFYGDYWHGNPKKFNSEDVHPVLKIPYGKLYHRTLTKANELRENGYNLIEVWEYDYIRSA